MVTHPYQGHYMEGAFISFVSWMIQNSKMMKEFEEVSGFTYSAPKSAIDKMIDEASGYNDKALQALFDFAILSFGSPSELTTDKLKEMS